jgi:trehalose 6-phosphate phosphatase
MPAGLLGYVTNSSRLTAPREKHDLALQTGERRDGCAILLTVMAVRLDDIRPLEPALAQRPFGLATDIDGTISPIVRTPDVAAVTPLCRRYLEQISQRVEVVAVISGRAPEVARRLVGVEDLVYVGNHGLSWWRRGQEETLGEAVPYETMIREAKEELAIRLDLPGLILEDKGPILAFHYRLCADHEGTRRAILAALARWETRGLRVREGRMVFELAPPVDIDKGTALARLTETYRLASVLYLGDDLTDVDAFRVLRTWRHGGKVGGAAIAVANPESGPKVMEEADYWVDGVPGVEWLLGEIATAVGAKRP